MSKKTDLEAYLGKGRVKEKVNLAPYLTMKTKTIARYFFEARTREDLIAAKKASLLLDIPLILIGVGSNLIIVKNKLDFLVVVNKYIHKEIIGREGDSVMLSVSSGYPVGKLIQETINEGLSGFEYHLGLPGTVGGAVFMNSKWTKPVSSFGDNLIYAFVIDNKGKVKRVEREYFQFSYGFSILQKTREILLEAVFKMRKTDPPILKEAAADSLKYRRLTQPTGFYTSGCFFKNITLLEKEKHGLPTTSAGYLIDKSGLKGLRVGNFYVSPKHANFIVHEGEGETADLLKLVKLIKKKVKEKFGIDLQEEVIVI